MDLLSYGGYSELEVQKEVQEVLERRRLALVQMKEAIKAND